MTDPRNNTMPLMNYHDFCLKNGELISALRRLLHADTWISHRGPLSLRILSVLLRSRKSQMRKIAARLKIDLTKKDQRLLLSRALRALKGIGIIDRANTSYVIQPLKRPAILIVWKDVSQGFRDRALVLYPDLERVILEQCRV